MLTKSSFRIPRELPPKMRFLSKPSLEVFHHLADVERMFAVYLIQNLDAPQTFNRENYSSTLLAIYEKSKFFEDHKQKLLAGEYQAKNINIDTNEILNSILAKKRILECGCRNACFLALCQKHGANIFGITDERYLEQAERKIGTDNVFNSRATQIVDPISTRASAFNPDYFISVNLLDSNRGFYPSIGEMTNILSTWKSCVSDRTEFILVPSVDCKSVLDFTFLQKVAEHAETSTDADFKVRGLSITSASPRIAYLSPRGEMRNRGIMYYFKLSNT